MASLNPKHADRRRIARFYIANGLTPKQFKVHTHETDGIIPIRVPDGSLQRVFIHASGNAFCLREKGLDVMAIAERAVAAGFNAEVWHFEGEPSSLHLSTPSVLSPEPRLYLTGQVPEGVEADRRV